MHNRYFIVFKHNHNVFWAIPDKTLTSNNKTKSLLKYLLKKRRRKKANCSSVSIVFFTVCVCFTCRWSLVKPYNSSITNMYIYIVYTGKPFQIQINYFKTWFSGFYTQLTYFQLVTIMHLFSFVSTKMGSEGFYFILNLTKGKKNDSFYNCNTDTIQVRGREKYCSTEKSRVGQWRNIASPTLSEFSFIFYTTSADLKICNADNKLPF